MQKMQSLREEDPPAQKKPDPGVLQLKADNTALVIIDVQERSDNWKEWRDETKNIKTLIEKCRTRNLPIIVLSLNFDGIKAIPRESGIGVKEYEVTGAHPKDYVRIIPELEAALKGYGKAIFLEKTTEDAFDEPRQGLEKALKENGIRNIIFAGFNEGICVKYAVESGVKKGYGAYTSIETMWGNQMNAGNAFLEKETESFYSKNTQFLPFDKLLETIAKIK